MIAAYSVAALAACCPPQQVVWAEDNAELWAAMEKTRMYVFRETDPEEPTLRCVTSCGGG